MKKSNEKMNLQLHLLPYIAFCATSTLLSSVPALAQLIPDKTLGTENSTVNQINPTTQRIDGGAVRASNLFHSFQEFNVGAGKGVYFSNPVGIENILTRVTGGNPSNIFGKLGVLGDSNLFLINPNGIMFGANASLDIKGSFLATTAPGIKLGENGFFSAVNPNQSQLLSVNPQVVFANNLVNPQAEIVNRGRLEAGKDLTLQGTNLDLQGQLLAKGNLILQALDTVKIEDSATNPFIAAAKENLLVQGNRGAEISALSHPDSGLFAGKDLILRSYENVLGDAHFWSGGSFKVEKLDGSLGGLYSPNDPVIRANGDVFLNFYQGASLHIFAGGSVNIPLFISIGSADPVEGIQENVLLSNGDVIQIDGKNQPTLDIRAGTTAFEPQGISSNFFNYFEFPTVNPPTSGDINVGSIEFADILSYGTVFLTNQYQPNSLLTGNINVLSITNNGLTDGGSVVIDSKGGIEVNGKIDASNILGNGRDVKLIANGDINLFQNSGINVDGGSSGGSVLLNSQGGITLSDKIQASSAFGNSGGDVKLMANEDIILLPNSGINVDGGFLGAGSVLLDSQGNISIGDSIISSKSDSSISGTNGGDINISARNFELSDNGQIQVTTKDGDAGNVNIQATDSIEIKQADVPKNVFGSGVINRTSGSGKAGDIYLETGRLSILDGASVSTQASELSSGRSGNLTIKANAVEVRGANLDSSNPNSLSTITLGSGNAGTLTIDTKQLFVEDGASISSFTSAAGNAGDIFVKNADTITLNNLGSLSAFSGGSGNGGKVVIDSPNAVINIDGSVISTLIEPFTSDRVERQAGEIQIAAKSVFLTNYSQISSESGSKGNGGLIDIRTNNLSLKNNSIIRATITNGGEGKGGDITLEVGSLSLTNGSQVQSSLFRTRVDSTLGGELPGGKGEAGNIKIRASDITISGIGETGFSSGIIVSSQRGAFGKAGNIDITANNFQIADGAVVSAATFNDGGQAGSINITATNLDLINGGQILTNTRSNQPAGNITLNIADKINISGSDPNFQGRLELVQRSINEAEESALITDVINNQGASSGVFANTSEDTTTGQGGKIQIDTKNLILNNLGTITANSRSRGKAGDININIGEDLQATDGDIVTSSQQSSGGAININASNIRLFGDSDISTNVNSGADNGGNITLNADSIIAFDDSDVVAFATDGKGGDITFNTPVFFGDGFRPAPEGTPPLSLEGNGVVDINASGAVSGTIALPNLDFVRNSITDLPENVVDTDTIIANSCVVANPQETGSFVITGSGGLPLRPGDATVSDYPTGKVRAIAESNSSSQQVIEPQGVYRLPDGKLVLSRRCD
jgi:filamentous hemagglutinin family protein